LALKIGFCRTIGAARATARRSAWFHPNPFLAVFAPTRVAAAPAAIRSIRREGCCKRDAGCEMRGAGEGCGQRDTACRERGVERTRGRRVKRTTSKQERQCGVWAAVCGRWREGCDVRCAGSSVWGVERMWGRGVE
jgi:hypothetical protein